MNGLGVLSQRKIIGTVIGILIVEVFDEIAHTVVILPHGFLKRLDVGGYLLRARGVLAVAVLVLLELICSIANGDDAPVLLKQSCSFMP